MGFRSGHHVSTHHVRETRNALHYIRRRYGALCAKPEQPSLPEHREETPQPEKNTDALSATHYAALFQDHVDQLQQVKFKTGKLIKFVLKNPVFWVPI